MPVVVGNVAPTLTDSSFSLPCGSSIGTLSGTFDDPSPIDTFDLTVDWGDGEVEVFSYTAGTRSFSETHDYSNKPFVDETVSFVLADDDKGATADNNLRAWDPCGGNIDVGVDAFIPSGIDPAPVDDWFPEPLGGGWEFHGDARGFGGPLEQSRVYARMRFDSSKIGQLTANDVEGGWGAGQSVRRKDLNGDADYNDAGEMQRKRATPVGRTAFTNHDRCSSSIILQVSGAYPFVALSPNIDITLGMRFTVVFPGEIRVDPNLIVHDSFPNYEVLVNGVTYYEYATADNGPGPINLNSLNFNLFPAFFIGALTPADCPIT